MMNNEIRIPNEPPNRTTVLLAFAAFLLFTIGAAMLYMSTTRANPDCPAGMVCMDPIKVSCFVFDMSHVGWKPVQKDERHGISVEVNGRRAEYKLQPEGVDCYRRDEHFLLREKIATLPVEWYRQR
jgi:hypothetical protein